MGRSITPTYRIEVKVDRGAWTPSTWRSQYGRPTESNLARWARVTEASTQPDGCNAHLGPVVILSARIIRQSTGDTVATYQKEGR